MNEKTISKPQALFDSLDEGIREEWTGALEYLASDAAQYGLTGKVIFAMLYDINDLKKGKFQFNDVISVEYSNLDGIESWQGRIDRFHQAPWWWKWSGWRGVTFPGRGGCGAAK